MDKIIYIVNDEHVILDVFEYKQGRELELIQFGVECLFKGGSPIVLNVGSDRQRDLMHGDYVLKSAGFENRINYNIFTADEYRDNVKKYSIKLIEQGIKPIEFTLQDTGIQHPCICEIVGCKRFATENGFCDKHSLGHL